jgi:hypothetical protein
MGYLPVLEPPGAALTASQTSFAVSISAAFLAIVEAAIMISHDTVHI